MTVRALPEGCEWRGFRFRAYPTDEQIVRIRGLQAALHRIRCALIADSDRVKDATEAAAIKAGVVGPRLPAPDYDKLEPSESKAAKAAFRDACRERRATIAKWAKGRPDCSFRGRKESLAHFGAKHPYQWARAMAGLDAAEAPPTMLVEALVHDYDAALLATKRGAKPPRKHRSANEVNLRVRTGKCLKLGQFGSRPGCPRGRTDWLSAQIKLPGVTPIACRIGPEQAELLNVGCMLEGVSLREEPDGWYASVRHAVAPPASTEPTPGLTCGIDVGLIDLCAIVRSDGETLLVPNPRRSGVGSYVEQIALRQAAGLPVGKMQCRARRNVQQIVREVVLPFVRQCEAIYVERLPSRLGQGFSHVSYLRTLVHMLPSDRVREVEPAFTSQDCSQCGTRSKETWSCEHGRLGRCPSCGHIEHRDLNAARNILRKGAEVMLPIAAE